jgi:hypothetical protein
MDVEDGHRRSILGKVDPIGEGAPLVGSDVLDELASGRLELCGSARPDV